MANEAADFAGVAGQGHSPNPPSGFGNHYIVKINGQLYDPSYGLGPYSDARFYESDAFAGFLKSGQLFNLPPNNFDPFDNSDEVNTYDVEDF